MLASELVYDSEKQAVHSVGLIMPHGLPSQGEDSPTKIETTLKERLVSSWRRFLQRVLGRKRWSHIL